VLLQESSDVGRSILAALQNTKFFKVTMLLHNDAELDQALATTSTADAVDVEHLVAVEHRDTDGVGRAPAQLLDVGPRLLAQARRVHRRHAEIGHSQGESVLAPGSLAQVSERD